MGDKSDIRWTDATANVVVGCSRVSDGCRHCYAESLAATRLKHTERYKGLAIVTEGGKPQWTGETRIVTDAIEQVIRWQKPRRIFLTAMGDPFHESLSNEQVAALFGMMAICPQHTFQVLTKRAERMREWFVWAAEQIKLAGEDGSWTPFIRELVALLDDAKLATRINEDGIARAPSAEAWPLPNVWLGTTVEDQRSADERIPHLLNTPAAVRFLSCEPLLEAVSLERWTHRYSTGHWMCGYCCNKYPQCTPCDHFRRSSCPHCRGTGYHDGLHWVIVGGESGPHARPFDLAWARAIVEQCKDAGTAVFCKQLGFRAQGKWLRGDEPLPCTRRLFDARDPDPSKHRFMLDDAHGGDMSEWPADLRVREMPGGAR